MLYITPHTLVNPVAKSVLFDHQQKILRTPADTTISNVAEDGEPWGLPHIVPWGVNWINHFGRQFVMMSYS